MLNPVIELIQVKKKFLNNQGEVVRALRDVNLKFNPGEFVAIMGPSGSGKTTLANIVGLLSQPTSGTVRFLGQECQGISDRKLTRFRRDYIGFIFQDYMLIEHMNALENVMLALHLSPLSSGKIRRQAKELLKRVGLEKYFLSYPKQLSGGQKQRVAIARALLKKPELILADEPAGALDPKSRREILGLLQELNEQGSTIVMVTHNPEDASAGTRLIRVQEARIADDRPIDDRQDFTLSA